MSASPPLIREATEADAPGIARVQVATWRHAYRGLVSRRFLDAMDVDERASRWVEILAGRSGPPGARDLVAVDDGAVCGFASAGPVREFLGPADLATGELYALYVVPDRIGSGLGRALMAATVDGLREVGHLTAVLWVLRGNARARRFYERAGWAPDGGLDPQTDGLRIPSVRYRRDL
jgi:GNAT superfamily N-acetyltransferase